jgi:hypothetical protein
VREGEWEEILIMFNCRKFPRKKTAKTSEREEKKQQQSLLATLNHPGAAESSSHSSEIGLNHPNSYRLYYYFI